MGDGVLTSGAFEIQPHELVAFLLRQTDQDAPGAVNSAALMDYLKLAYLSVDFRSSLSQGLSRLNSATRALVSFPDRLVAVDAALHPKQIRFSVLHEIAHYVLPTHQHALYLCDSEGLSQHTRLDFEIQANEFAADLLFKGRHFLLEASGEAPSARTVKTLATRYDASFEATARRCVETSLRDVMLAVFAPVSNRSIIDPSTGAQWGARYCVTSSVFRSRRFSGIRGEVPDHIVKELTAGYRDVADSIIAPLRINSQEGLTTLRAEWFFNQYNIMALLSPMS